MRPALNHALTAVARELVALGQVLLLFIALGLGVAAFYVFLGGAP